MINSLHTDPALFVSTNDCPTLKARAVTATGCAYGGAALPPVDTTTLALPELTHGTVTVSCVGDDDRTTALAPLMDTVLRLLTVSNRTPVIVAVAPGINVVGEMEVTTGASALAVTNTVADPVCDSLVAAISTVPGANVVTNPLASTAATAVLLLLHATARAVRAFPWLSRRVAVSCCVPFTTTTALVGETETVATGAGNTVSDAEPVTPPLEAETVVVPCATAVSEPLVLTVAMPELADVHVTVRSVNTTPFAAFTVALSA